MLMLLLAGAALPTAVDAERAFARDAQRRGQWTAFRAYADPDAVMFTPQVIWAHEFLRNRKDPPQSVRWWPASSVVSCDRRTAVNSGPSFLPSRGTHGYFTTVWQREKGRWLWVYDAGDSLDKPLPRPRRPKVRVASCEGRPTGAPLMATPPAVKRRGSGPPDDFGRGHSADHTLGWDWKVDSTGARRFRAFLWNGSRYEQVLYQEAAGT